jgi:hypothetical protein
MARPPRHRIELVDEERLELVRIARAEKLPWQEVQRARIVLYAAEGLHDTEIAQRLDTTPGPGGPPARYWRSQGPSPRPTAPGLSPGTAGHRRLNTVRQIGGSIGTTLLAVMLQPEGTAAPSSFSGLPPDPERRATVD